MRIRKLAFENHPVLGNLELDFTDKNGEPVDTIILAGENGVGKSLIFNILFSLERIEFESDLRKERRFFEIQFSDDEIEIFKKSQFTRQYFIDFIPNIFRIYIDYSKPAQQQIILQLNKPDWPKVNIQTFQMTEVLEAYKVVFSDIGINFTPSPVTNITSKNIDKKSNRSVRSTDKLATEITQLLIDIQSLDALDYSDWARKNTNKRNDPEKLDQRMRRFTNAFEYMFPTKKYSNVKTEKERKVIVFEDNGNSMSISQLSSGEKQIVFRGGFLLRDKETSKGALILIDEPEISMHPSWQLKILEFYKKLFIDEHGIQTSQLIVATHSPFIIHNSNRNHDKVIVLKKGDDGKTIIASEPTFYGWTMEETIKEAFDVSNLIDKNKITTFVEGSTDEKYYNACAKIFGRNDLNVSFQWIGRNNEKGVENSGQTALNQAYNFFKANPEQIKNKIVLLYDIDTNKPEEDSENLSTRIMTKNNENQTFKRGIENLLTLIPELVLEDFYTTTTKQDEYGGENTTKKLDKVKLCNFICDSLPIEKQKVVLANLNKEIDRLADLAS